MLKKELLFTDQKWKAISGKNEIQNLSTFLFIIYARY